jgi:hypothetical protein
MMTRPWSQSEIDVVREEYPVANPREIAVRLNRSLKAVQQMAAYLGVKKKIAMPTHQFRPLSERFWEKVNKTDECWIWTAYKDPSGYGRIGVGTGMNKAMRLATHVAWYLQHGEWPEKGAEMCHACDTPGCVRVGPGHLYKGTKSANMRDVWQRNRNAMQRNLEKRWNRTPAR